jgi:putative transposase
MPDYHIPLYPDNIYHILSHAAGNEKLFKEPKNFDFFLKKYCQHITPVADTFCYCLLPSHFHFMIRIKGYDEIEKHFTEKKKDRKFIPEIAPDFIMERFSNWLNSYTKSFNKVYKRKGSLFIDYLRRIEVKKDGQFSDTIFYVHKNPVHHGYCKTITEWPASSYNILTGIESTFLMRDEIIDWFGSMDQFIKFHERPIDLKGEITLE